MVGRAVPRTMLENWEQLLLHDLISQHRGAVRHGVTVLAHRNAWVLWNVNGTPRVHQYHQLKLRLVY